MKANIVIAALPLFVLGCAAKQSDDLTQQQKDQIKMEAKAAFDGSIERFQNMDVEGALKYYSPEFVFFEADQRGDFQAYRKICIEGNNAATAYNWTLYRMEFLVITKEIVVLSVDGRNEIFMKSGDRITFDPSHYTFAMKNMSGQWKLTYHHFSGNFETRKAEKK